jgi:hypothetical protein
MRANKAYLLSMTRTQQSNGPTMQHDTRFLLALHFENEPTTQHDTRLFYECALMQRLTWQATIKRASTKTLRSVLVPSMERCRSVTLGFCNAQWIQHFARRHTQESARRCRLVLVTRNGCRHYSSARRCRLVRGTRNGCRHYSSHCSCQLQQRSMTHTTIGSSLPLGSSNVQWMHRIDRRHTNRRELRMWEIFSKRLAQSFELWAFWASSNETGKA